MKNRTKGVVAGVAGVALLAGGTTFALWSDSADVDGGTITNGNLDVAALQTTWKDVSYDRTDSPHSIDLDAWRMVPGDTVEGTQDLDVALQGDNLVATLKVVDSGTKQLADLVEVEYDVVRVQDGVVIGSAELGRAVPVNLQAADNPDDVGRTEVGAALDGNADLSVVLRVRFDPTDMTTAQEEVLEASVLSGLSVSLDQVRTGPGFSSPSATTSPTALPTP